MSTLQTQLSDLLGGLETHRQTQAREQEAETYEHRRQEIRALRDGLEEAVRRLVMIRSAAASASDPPDTSKTRKHLDGVSVAFAESPESLTKGRNYSNLKKALEKLQEDCKSSADAAWEALKADQQTVDKGFLRQLRALPQERDKVQLIDAAVEELTTKGRKFPSTPDDLKAYIAAAKRVRKLAKGIRPEEFPKAVLKFYAEVQKSPQGAPLRFLTDEVREWLDERDELKSVRVRIVAGSK